MKNYLVLDIGGSSVKSGIINEDIILSRLSGRPVHKESVDAFMQDIKAAYEETGIRPDGIAVSLAGTQDRKTSDIINEGAFPFLKGQNIKELFSRWFDEPVSVVNDAVAAALAEMKYGVLKDVKNAAVITLGSAVGTCLIIDGRIISGEHHFAGQGSLVKTDGKPGFDGMWALTSGASGLLKEVQTALQTDAVYTGYEIFEMAENGNEDALSAIEFFCEKIAVQIHNIQALLDVQTFVIGGGISEQPLLAKILQKKVDEVFMYLLSGKVPMAKPDLAICTYGNSSNLVGAYANFCEQYHL